MIRGFACGVFDLFHAGHAIMLKECKTHCEHLTVAINSAINLGQDKNTPVFSIEERFEILRSIKYVDEVLIYNSEEELVELMGRKHYHVRFLGDDYRNKPITSPEVISKIVFLNRDHGFSSSRIRNKIKYLE